MIERKGTHVCEYFGKSYDWVARKNEKGEIVISNLDDIICHNVQFFGEVNGRLIAEGHCPFCGMLQRTRFVGEKV